MVDEVRHLENHRLDTITCRYVRAFETEVDPDKEFTLALLNTRSLSTHAKDMERDPVLGESDVLCVMETWNAGTNISGYDAAAYTRQSTPGVPSVPKTQPTTGQATAANTALLTCAQ